MYIIGMAFQRLEHADEEMLSKQSSIEVTTSRIEELSTEVAQHQKCLEKGNVIQCTFFLPHTHDTALTSLTWQDPDLIYMTLTSCT